MAHYLTIPINENGIVSDTSLPGNMTLACSVDFGFNDIFLYSHGWWTNADSALCMYNRFSTEFTDKLIRLKKARSLPNIPDNAFGIGLHWPSTLTEDTLPGILGDVEAVSFYTMERRADTVGTHALYSIVRMALGARQDQDQPLTLHFLGHSFGTKVVCAALQAIASDFPNAKDTIKINVVLLQAAFQNNNLEANEDYNQLCSSPLEARVLMTTSNMDLALKDQFPLAQRINLFKTDADIVAMGFGGPTPATEPLFGGCDRITVNHGFSVANYSPTPNRRLMVADITPLHAYNQQEKIYIGDNFGGHHSDINISELYELIAAFLFR